MVDIKEALSNAAVSFTETALHGLGVGLIAYGGAECLAGAIAIASGGIKNGILGTILFISGLYTAGVGMDSVKLDLYDGEVEKPKIRLEFQAE